MERSISHSRNFNKKRMQSSASIISTKQRKLPTLLTQFYTHLFPNSQQTLLPISPSDDYTRRQRRKKNETWKESLPLYLTFICVLVFYVLLFRTYSSLHAQNRRPLNDDSLNKSTVIPTRNLVINRHENKQLAVRKAFEHAWRGYEKYAYGHDELRPTTNATNDSWGAMGATLVDALDTMFIMGFSNEFNKATEHIRLHLNPDQDKKVSFFETTIRYIGGLVSAYTLSKQKVLLDKAVELADRLLPAYDKKTGYPFHEVNLKTGEANNAQWTGHSFILSEISSIQIEFQQLSYLSGVKVYGEKADTAFENLIHLHSTTHQDVGLYPVLISSSGTEFVTPSHITLGGLADSTYEYLLKQYLLGGKKNPQYLRLFLESVLGIQKRLLTKWSPTNSGGKTYLFPSELHSGRKGSKFEHLACFVPGMFALASQQLTDEEIEAQSNDFTQSDKRMITRATMLQIAKKLLETCVFLYDRQKTGIGADTVEFREDGNVIVSDPKYLLRPETIESIYILYQVTGDEQYIDQGWRIFQAIEKFCKTAAAYSGLSDVETGEQNNSMQSFFFAETLKYLYLLFSGRSHPYTFDNYVFTTEAHVFKIQHH